MVMETITVEVPKSFVWVLRYMKEFHKEKTTGEMKFIYKDGGITAVIPSPYIKAK
jgi:hypothetical protein